jgi:hypothetical protein
VIYSCRFLNEARSAFVQIVAEAIRRIDRKIIHALKYENAKTFHGSKLEDEQSFIRNTGIHKALFS